MLGVSLTIRGIVGLKASEINECVRKAMEAIGWRWRERYLHKRFTRAGAREYGFRQRDGEQNPRKRGTYTNRKLRLFGHTLPLRYTSESYNEAMFTLKVVTATATSSRATVRIRLPRKANFWINEWRAVSAAELVDLQNALAGHLSFELQKAGARKTFVIAQIGGGASGIARAA